MTRTLLACMLAALVALIAPAQVNIGPSAQAGAHVASMLSGLGNPPNSMGSDGDFYINTSSYCLWGPRASGAWPSSCVPLKPGYVAENAANKGVPGGYAPLDPGGFLPSTNLPAAAVTTTNINNATLPANFVGLLTTSDVGVGGNLNVTGSIYAGVGSSSPACYHFTDSNAAHDTVLCAPANGFNGTFNLWTGLGASGQAAITDGAGNLQWSNLSGIAGSLASTQFPSQFGMTPNWFLSWAPLAATSGSPNILAVTAPAHTTLASAEVNDLYWNGTRTVQITGGTTLPVQRSLLFTPPAYAFTTATAITAGATMAISGPPSAGANATISGSYGLWLQNGAVSGTVSNAYGLRADAPTGATYNWAAFLNGPTSIGPSAATGSSAATTLTVFNGTGAGNTSLVIKAATATPGASLLKVADNTGNGQVQIDSGFNLAMTGGAGQHIKTAQQTTDIAGTAQLASGTVSVTFTTVYSNTPVCVANSRNTTNAIRVVPSTTGVSFTSSSGTDTSVVNYICIGNPN